MHVSWINEDKAPAFLIGALTTVCSVACFTAFYFCSVDSRVYDVHFEQAMLAGKHTLAQRRFTTSAAYFKLAENAARLARRPEWVASARMASQKAQRAEAGSKAQSHQHPVLSHMDDSAAKAFAAHHELRLNEAKAAYKEAIQQALAGNHQADAAILMKRMADVCVLKSESKSSNALYDRAAELALQLNDLRLAHQCLQALSHLQFDSKNNEKCISTLEKDLAVCEKLYGPESLETAAVLADLGMTLLKRSHGGHLSREVLHRAEKIYRANPPAYQQYEMFLQTLAERYERRRGLARAREIQQRRIALLEDHLDKNSEWLAAAKVDLGHVTRDPKAAIPILEEAVSVLEQHPDATLVRGYSELAIKYLAAKRPEEAAETVQRGLQLAQKIKVRATELTMMHAKAQHLLGNDADALLIARGIIASDRTGRDWKREARLLIDQIENGEAPEHRTQPDRKVPIDDD